MDVPLDIHTPMAVTTPPRRVLPYVLALLVLAAVGGFTASMLNAMQKAGPAVDRSVDLAALAGARNATPIIQTNLDAPPPKPAVVAVAEVEAAQAAQAANPTVVAPKPEIVPEAAPAATPAAPPAQPALSAEDRAAVQSIF